MLTHFLLPLLSVVFGVSLTQDAPAPVSVTAPRTAQVELAVTLAEADAIQAIGHRANQVIFAIDRDGDAYEVVATLAPRGIHKGEVIALTITDVGPAIGDVGGLSWIGAELADATAVTTLAVDAEGAVTLTTSDGRMYMAIPGRGSGGNAGVEARWAAAWNTDEG